MHVLETSIQQLVNVALEDLQINDLIAVLPEIGRTLALAQVAARRGAAPGSCRVLHAGP